MKGQIRNWRKYLETSF